MLLYRQGNKADLLKLSVCYGFKLSHGAAQNSPTATSAGWYHAHFSHVSLEEKLQPGERRTSAATDTLHNPRRRPGLPWLHLESLKMVSSQ